MIVNKNKKIVLILIIVFVFITSFLSGCYNDDEGYKKMEILDFPSDEGRHEGFEEAWNFGCYVQSSEGNSYFCGVVYQLPRSNERMSQLIGVLDIDGSYGTVRNSTYFSLTTKSNSFNYDNDKLNIRYGPSERWSQISSNPYVYEFVANFNDQGRNFSFDFEIKSNKGPTVEIPLGFMGEEYNNSYLYDHTNVDVSGYLTIGYKKMSVSGIGVIDRVWGDRLVGDWNWFAIRFSDNYDLVAMKTQSINGKINIGYIVNPQGKVKKISDLEIKPVNYTDRWWIKKWFITSNDIDLNLTVEIIGNLIEYDILYVREATCRVNGIWKDKSIIGNGFVEQSIRFLN